jgi:Fur family ferric uptake transcriptional regulator
MGRTIGALDSADVAEILHEAGLRATTGRRQIVQSLATLGHATPEEVFEHVSPEVPGLNISTVYRTLETLAHVGLAFHAHLTGLTRTYYLAGDDEHGHLVCDSCGSITELSAPPLQRFSASVNRVHGFEIHGGHLAVHGHCSTCRLVDKQEVDEPELDEQELDAIDPNG